MKLDDVFKLLKVAGARVDKVPRFEVVRTTAGEFCDMIEAAYNAGREETQSELAAVIALNPIEAEVSR